MLVVCPDDASAFHSFAMLLPLCFSGFTQQWLSGRFTLLPQWKRLQPATGVLCPWHFLPTWFRMVFRASAAVVVVPALLLRWLHLAYTGAPLLSVILIATLLPGVLKTAEPKELMESMVFFRSFYGLWRVSFHALLLLLRLLLPAYSYFYFFAGGGTLCPGASLDRIVSPGFRNFI